MKLFIIFSELNQAYECIQFFPHLEIMNYAYYSVHAQTQKNHTYTGQQGEHWQ